MPSIAITHQKTPYENHILKGPVRIGLLTTAYCLLATLAYADCSSPTGKEGEQVYNGTHKVMQFCNGTNWMSMGSPASTTGTLFSRATAVATTSGTVINYSVPSTATAIWVVFSGVSLSGSSNVLIQIGGSGGVENSGYLSAASVGGLTATSTAGFLVYFKDSSTTHSGAVQLFNLSGDTWVSSGVVHSYSANTDGVSGGTKTLASTITQLRITTVNGTDTFDAGSVNIFYM